jgi:hypothetical protein
LKFLDNNKEIMGASTFSKHDLEMIEISWLFAHDKQSIGLNTMIIIFETSKEIKNLFGFASSLDLVNHMMENEQVNEHASQVIKTLDKIIILLTQSSSLSEQDKETLIKLGQQHYHFGLKKQYFTV